MADEGHPVLLVILHLLMLTMLLLMLLLLLLLLMLLLLNSSAASPPLFDAFSPLDWQSCCVGNIAVAACNAADAAAVVSGSPPLSHASSSSYPSPLVKGWCHFLNVL